MIAQRYHGYKGPFDEDLLSMPWHQKEAIYRLILIEEINLEDQTKNRPDYTKYSTNELEELLGQARQLRERRMKSGK